MRRALLLLLLLAALPTFAQTPHDRIILTTNSSVGQGYISDVSIFAGNVVTLNSSGHLSLASHTTVAGVLGVVRANGNSGATLMVDEVGQSFVLVDGACTTGNFIAKSTTADGQGHCSSSLPAVELIGYANASIGSAGVVSTALNIGSGSSSGAVSFGALTPGTNSAAGSFIATGNTWDFSAATLLRARIGAGLVTTTTGDFGFDTTNGNWHFWAGGADRINAVFSGTIVTGDCLSASISSGFVSIVDAGFACGSGTGAVTSVFGRTGVVVATSGDYTLSQITATYSVPLQISGNTLSILGCANVTCVFNGLAPATTPPVAGSLIYNNGTNWVALSGNNVGTKFLIENSSGVPSLINTLVQANATNAFSIQRGQDAGCSGNLLQFLSSTSSVLAQIDCNGNGTFNGLFLDAGSTLNLFGSAGTCTASTATTGGICAYDSVTSTIRLVNPSQSALAALTSASDTPSAFGVAYMTGTFPQVGFTGVGTAGFVLTSNGPGVAPTFQTAIGSVAFSALTASTNTNTGTFAATGNSWDFTGTTIFKLRSGAALTTSANGDIGFDTTNKNWHTWANAADEIMAVFSTPVGSLTNGHCPNISVVSGVISLVDSGNTCGGTIFPVTVSGTVVSGGIPYFNSTTQESSSALLAAGQFVLGGGAGAAPSTTFSVVPPFNGGTGLSNPTPHALLVTETGSFFSLLISPSTFGTCVVNFPVGTGGAVDPTCALPGVPVDKESAASVTVQGDVAGTDRVSLLVTTNNTTSTAVSIAQAGSANFGANFAFVHCNTGTVVATDGPTGSTVNGNSSLVLVGKAAGGNPECAFWYSDNSNYFAAEVLPTDANGRLAVAGFPALTGDVTGTAGSFSLTVTRINGTAFAGVTGDVVTYGASNIPVDAGFLATNVVLRNTVNTAAAAMTLDMSATTTVGALRVSNIAACAPTVDGQLCENTTTHHLVVGSNGVTFDLQQAGGTPTFPITVAGTVTSGGIPYFSSTTVESSSALLTANALIKGGGAGGAPSSSLLSDNATTLTYTGTGGVTAPFFNASTGPGQYVCVQGADAGVGAAHTITIECPTAVTAYAFAWPTATGTINQVLTVASVSSSDMTLAWTTLPGGVPTFPITVAGTVTSGGIPCFTATTTESSSTLLAANGLMLGGGAGTCPSTVAGISSDGVSQVKLGVAGTSVGSTLYANLTSGSVTLKPVTGALGSITISLPALTGTVVVGNSFTALTDGATVTWALGSAFQASASLTFTVHSGSRTLNITNPINGGVYALWIKQDATGGEGLTLGTGCTWKVSGGGSGAITPSTGANAIDFLTFMYDGTNCYLNFNKNFN